MPGRTVTGWKLDRDQRPSLLARFPPAYPDVVADHVTLQAGSDSSPPAEAQAEIVGEADDGAGVQALVVRLNGTTDRPGGGTYHITWSLGSGREARESNDVIAALGWRPCPVQPVSLTPTRWTS